MLFCVHNWKHSPAYRRAFEAVSAGGLGELRYCALSRLRTRQAGGALWRIDPVIGGGGILIDHGWHAFYLMQWLMGGRAPLSVAARLGVFPPGVVEEVADLSLTFPGGALGLHPFVLARPGATHLGAALRFGGDDRNRRE